DADAAGGAGGERLEAGDDLLVGRYRPAVGGDGAVVGAGEEKPAEGRVPAVPRSGPPGHRLVLSPGQGDIGQAEILTPLLGDVLVPMAIESRAPLPAHVDGAAVAGIGVVEDGSSRPGEVAGLPQVRGVDDGELEALAPVDGEDLHRLGVGLEAPAAL